MAALDDVQTRYVAELRAIAPELRAWWKHMCALRGEQTMLTRWPTGISGHPRTLAVFRKYYFEIEALNDEAILDEEEDNEDDDDDVTEDMWGEDDDDDDEGADIGDHAELLIYDIEELAPDIYELVDGICYVPVGLTPDEDPV
ncbi:MAG: hypothetical protein E5Y89_16625 [Mesorhizobium sp.]|nr:MAG: hypothetical protein E5Y89_16625 [Mesorhizobium sp.]